MENWRKFELECVDYLNTTYGNYFSHLGFSDSTTSDIEYKKDEKSFFIEARCPQHKVDNLFYCRILIKRSLYSHQE